MPPRPNTIEAQLQAEEPTGLPEFDNRPRHVDERDADLRDFLGDVADSDSLLFVPEKYRRPDTELRWVRESTLMQRDTHNLQLVIQREGFRPVTADEMPELQPPILPGDDPEKRDKLIRAGGLILMQRPARYGQMARMRHAQANAEALAAARRDFNKRMDGENFATDRSSSVTVERAGRRTSTAFAE